MRLATATALALTLAGLTAAGPVSTGGAAGAEGADTTPSRMGVRGDEYDLVLSRTRLPRGPAVIQFQNAGEDPHDLNLARVGGVPLLETTGEVPPSEVANLEPGWLKAGKRYRLWCSLPSHVDWGMEAFFRVKRKR